MTKNDITKRAFLDAVGVVVYVALFALLVNYFHQIFGSQPDGMLGMILFIVLFIISACVTGSLVLLKPAMLYHDGMKKEAMHLFAYTVGFLAILAVLLSFAKGSSYSGQMNQVNKMNPNLNNIPAQNPTPSPNPTPIPNPLPKPVPTPVPVTGGRCGGNTTHPLQCPMGSHCAPAPGSHLPFGDVGGICVVD
jgi:hypothetical protein